MDQNRKKLYDAFVQRPTTYTIDVIDGSMLPEPGQKEVKITIAPPTMMRLMESAAVLDEIPDQVYQDKEIDMKEVMRYSDQIARVLSVLSHGASYPEWLPEFIIKNVPTVDLLRIMQEVAVKCSPGFFLNSIQVAKESNPMTMTPKKTDSTLTDS